MRLPIGDNDSVTIPASAIQHEVAWSVLESDLLQRKTEIRIQLEQLPRATLEKLREHSMLPAEDDATE